MKLKAAEVICYSVSSGGTGSVCVCEGGQRCPKTAEKNTHNHRRYDGTIGRVGRSYYGMMEMVSVGRDTADMKGCSEWYRNADITE